jgi:hypothetical protein
MSTSLPEMKARREAAAAANNNNNNTNRSRSTARTTSTRTTPSPSTRRDEQQQQQQQQNNSQHVQAQQLQPIVYPPDASIALTGSYKQTFSDQAHGKHRGGETQIPQLHVVNMVSDRNPEAAKERALRNRVSVCLSLFYSLSDELIISNSVYLSVLLFSLFFSSY